MRGLGTRMLLTGIVVMGLSIGGQTSGQEVSLGDEDLLSGGALPCGQRPRLFSKAADIARDVLGRVSDTSPEDLMAILQEQFPLRMREFREMSETHAADALDYFRSLVRDARLMLEARKRNPDLFKRMVKQREVNRAIEELVLACNELQGDANALLKKQAELRQALKSAFDLKQDALKDDLKRLEKETTALKETIRTREDNRDAIVERRMLELTAGGDSLDW